MESPPKIENHHNFRGCINTKCLYNTFHSLDFHSTEQTVATWSEMAAIFEVEQEKEA